MSNSNLVNRCLGKLNEPAFFDFFSNNTCLISQDQVYIIDAPTDCNTSQHFLEIFGEKWAATKTESLSRLEKMYIVDNAGAIEDIIAEYFDSEISAKNREKAELNRIAAHNSTLVFAVDPKNGLLFRDLAIEKSVAEKLSRISSGAKKGMMPAGAQKNLGNPAKSISGASSDSLHAMDLNELESAVFSEILSRKTSLIQQNLSRAGQNSELFFVLGGEFYSLSQSTLVRQALAASENANVFRSNGMYSDSTPSEPIRVNGRDYLLKPVASVEEIADNYRKALADEIIRAAEKYDVDRGPLTIAGMNKESFLNIVRQFNRNTWYQRNNLGIRKTLDDYYLYIWINNGKPYALVEKPKDMKNSNKYYFDSVMVAVKIEMFSNGIICPPSPEGFVVTPYHHPFVSDSQKKFERVCADKTVIQSFINNKLMSLGDKYYTVLKCVENTLLMGYRPNSSDFRPHHWLTLTEFSEENRKYDSLPAYSRPEITNVLDNVQE